MPLNLLPERLESPRLVIRVARPGDGAAFHEAVHASLPELAPWLRWVTPAPTLEQSELNCRRAHARYLLNEDLMVDRKSTRLNSSHSQQSRMPSSA